MTLRENVEKVQEKVEKVQEKVERLDEETDLIRILKIEDKKNKRLCLIIALLAMLLSISFGYIVYLHNDIGTEEIITENYEIDQETGDNGNNNFINGDNNEVNN